MYHLLLWLSAIISKVEGNSIPSTSQMGLFYEVAVQEGNHLSACASSIGTELVVAGALGDPVLNGPLDRLCIVRIGLNVGKGDGAADRLSTGHTAEEGRHLCAWAGSRLSSITSVKRMLNMRFDCFLISKTYFSGVGTPKQN